MNEGPRGMIEGGAEVVEWIEKQQEDGSSS
jgi:hypothetical protein